MTFAENKTYGVPEFAGTEVNRHSGKLKGLSGYLQYHHDTMVGDKTQQTSTNPANSRASTFIWMKRPQCASTSTTILVNFWGHQKVNIRLIIMRTSLPLFTQT